MDDFVRGVLEKIKNSEESAIEKQKLIVSFEEKITDDQNRCQLLDEEIIAAKKDLKLTETEEINHLVLLEEVEKRLTSFNMQSTNVDGQIGAEIRSRDDMISMATAEVDAVVKAVNEFSTSFGVLVEQEQREINEEELRQKINGKLVESKEQYKILNSIEIEIREMTKEQETLAKLEAELKELTEVRRNTEEEAEVRHFFPV